MALALLTVENLTKQYGEKLLMNNVSFGINEGQKTALIARNGKGKSTLLNILMGKELPDEGRVTFREGLRVAYLPQTPLFSKFDTVKSFMFSSQNSYVRLTGRYEELLLKMKLQPSKVIEDELQRCISEMDVMNAWDYDNRIKEVLSRLAITNLDAPMEQLSGGEQKKVSLARTLIDDVDLLLLDEPTNHLDIRMIEWLEEFLSKQKLSILMVTHDRYFLNAVCQDILELDNATLYHYKGTYDYYLEKKAERLEQEKASIEKARSLYRTELEWMRRMPQARGTKAKARIDAFYELQEKAHTRIDNRRMSLSVKDERLGGKIVELYNVSKAYNGKTLFRDFSYAFKKGERVGIVGGNGVGKSTFINVLTEALRPDEGRVVVGQTVRFGYYTQQGLKSKDDMRVIDILRETADVLTLADGKELSAHQFLTHFGFEATTQYNYYGNLSGGERRRLYLLQVLMANPNFLILDEPTNDLDIYILEVLEDFLLNYKGCLLIVSHDRSFMDDLVDHILVFEGDGSIRDYHGTYTEYRALKQREQRAATLQQREEKPRFERRASSAPKVTYKERKEYESLTNEIDELTKEKQELEHLLSGEQEASVEAISAASQRIGELIALLDEKELRWLELDEKGAGN